MFDEISTHVENAQARLLFEYQDATLLNAMIAAFVEPMQLIEQVLLDMNNFRSLTTAYGQQLDNLGKIIGIIRRPGQTDAQYLISLYGQIGVNRSNGYIEDIISAWLTYTGTNPTCVIFEFYPAEFYIQTNYTFATELAETQAVTFIQAVAAVGVKFIGFGPDAPVVNFAFDGPQVGNKGAGFGDLNDPNVGGFWSNELDPTIPT